MFSALVLMEDSGAGMVLAELAATSQQVSIVKSLDRAPSTHYEIARLLSIEPDLVFLDLRTPESALDLLKNVRACTANTASRRYHRRLAPALRRNWRSGISRDPDDSG